MKSLPTTIDGIKKDVSMTIEDIKKVAEDIDNKVGLEHI